MRYFVLLLQSNRPDKQFLCYFNSITSHGNISLKFNPRFFNHCTRSRMQCQWLNYVFLHIFWFDCNFIVFTLVVYLSSFPTLWIIALVPLSFPVVLAFYIFSFTSLSSSINNSRVIIPPPK